jgi:methionyl-tRNA synthetase
MEDNSSTITPQPTAAPVPPEPATVSFDEFKKLDIRVAQIIEAERVPNADKLLRMQISLGETLGKRQIVAGIAQHFKPEDLVGRKIVVITNLKPVKLRGILSEAMLLAAIDEPTNTLELVSPGNVVPPGAVVR